MHKYREGKMKITLERELNSTEIIKGEVESDVYLAVLHQVHPEVYTRFWWLV